MAANNTAIATPQTTRRFCNRELLSASYDVRTGCLVPVRRTRRRWRTRAFTNAWSGVERATRIELAFSAWEADVLPLNYARVRFAPYQSRIWTSPRHRLACRRDPLRPHDPRGAGVRPDPDRPHGRVGHPAVVRRPAPRPLLPRLPESQHAGHRRERRPGEPLRAR